LRLILLADLRLSAFAGSGDDVGVFIGMLNSRWMMHSGAALLLFCCVLRLEFTKSN
jgi:hypothetical protein